MDASQYGDDPDSAYGDEVYVQLSASDFSMQNDFNKVSWVTE